LVHKKKPEDIVLNTLCKYIECNFNTLRRKTGLNYYTLVKTINYLVSKGLIVEKRVGRLRIIRIAEHQRAVCMDRSPSTQYTS